MKSNLLKKKKTNICVIQDRVGGEVKDANSPYLLVFAYSFVTERIMYLLPWPQREKMDESEISHCRKLVFLLLLPLYTDRTLGQSHAKSGFSPNGLYITAAAHVHASL